MKNLIVLSTLLLISSANALEIAPQTRGIYGTDNRISTTELEDSYLKLMSKAVALQVPSHMLETSPTNPNQYVYKKYVLGDEMNLCPDERFADEQVLGICTGFLISEDTMVTAGHCILDEKDCHNMKWVFDYNVSGSPIDKKNVYSCKNIIRREFVQHLDKRLDYTIVKLDKKTARMPLKVRTQGKVRAGTPLAIIGYPIGISQKYADDAKVAWRTKEQFSDGVKGYITSRKLDKYVFRTNLDAFEGNSGSPVINLKTMEVEGILIEGADDYDLVDYYGDGNKWCRKVHESKSSAWHGEELVQRITQLNIVYR